MSTWLATHGIGAIADSASSFTITVEGGSAVVKPTKGTGLSGWIHYTIPSPPPANAKLQTLAVKLTAQGAKVQEVKVFLANDEVFSKTNMQAGSDITQSILGDTAVYVNGGIAVSLMIQFQGMGDNVSFQSVAIEC